MRTKIIGFIALAFLLSFSMVLVSCGKGNLNNKLSGVITSGDKSIKIEQVLIGKLGVVWDIWINVRRDLTKSGLNEDPSVYRYMALNIDPDENGKKIELDKASSTHQKAWSVEFYNPHDFFSGSPSKPSFF